MVNSITTTCPVSTTPRIAVTKHCPPQPTPHGGTLTFSGTVSNLGNVTLINVYVVNNQPSNNTPVIGPITLAPGAFLNFSGSYIVPPLCCSMIDTLTARGQDRCSSSNVSATATAICPLLYRPSILVVQNCPPSPMPMGSVYRFSGYVTNTGDAILTNVLVFSSQAGQNLPLLGPLELAPGESEVYNGSLTVPFNTCAVSVTATSQETCAGTWITNTGTCPIATTPQIAVTLACPEVPASAGGSIIYTGTVRNSGDVTLNNVFVLINQSAPSRPVMGPITMAEGKVTVSWTAMPGVTYGLQYRSNLVDSAWKDIAGYVTASSGTASKEDFPGGASQRIYRVRTVSGSPVFGPLTLAPGAASSFSASFTAPTNACSVSGTVTATGWSICGVAVTNTVSATCPVTTTPLLAITQHCPANPVSPGGLLTYSGTVSNAGNITLNNLVVTNNQSGNTPLISVATLTPGGSTNFTGSYIAPATGATTSTSTARATSLCGVPVTNTASSTCPILTSPGIAITKACPPQPVAAGGTLVFTGTVTNTGNITLTNVFIVDNQPAPNTPVLGPITLARGAGTNFSGSYAVALDACATTDTLIATGNDSNTGIAITNGVSVTCPIITIPTIAITQSCPPNPVSPGGLLTYSGRIRNAGNISLNNIVVINDRSGATPVFTAATLAPGASATFTGSYAAPASGDSTSTSTVRATSLCNVAVTNNASSTCPILTSPGIAITKACPPQAVAAGGTLVFTGTVTNTGNITLTNVFVVDNQPVPNSPVLGPITLARGAGTNFSGSYAVALDACATTDTLIATGNDSNTGIAITNSVSVTCPIITIPSIAITQSCPPNPVSPGDLLTYSGRIRNAGNISLNNIVVINDRSGATPVFTAATLAPGASATFTGSYAAPASGDSTSTSTVRATSLCNVAVTNNASSTCPILTSPGIAITKACPPQPVAAGGTLVFTGTVTNTGNITLTNVFIVDNQPAPNTPVLGPIILAPGAGTNFSGSYVVPLNVCSLADMLTATGNNASTGIAIANTVSANCPITTTPGIAITETCPPGPVTQGSLVVFGGLVSNNGDITLTNILVFSLQPSNNTPVLGPITLAPGASAPFTGSYIALGGSNPTTNTTILTNSSSTITTNVVSDITTNNTVVITTNAPTSTSFVTINTISQVVVDRFVIGTNFNGLTYAGEDHGYGATEFYSMRKANTGISFFDTIIASTAATTDRFEASTRDFDALAYAAPDLGYGPVIFYYLSHDLAGVSTFGSITPGGEVGVIADHFVVGVNFDALTFTATDVGYGANLFYYVRHDASGLSTFGTINPALPGTITDRFTVGNDVDALVFTDLIAPGYGPNNFYYLRHNASGVSTLGTIFVTGLNTATVTDRFALGTNLTELTFTATDVGFGANLFYSLRGSGLSLTTNIITSFITNTVTTFTTNTVIRYTTNSVVSFTATNTVTVTGLDACQARTVAAAANCPGPVAPSPQFSPLVQLLGAAIRASMAANGSFSLSFPSEKGTSYTVQYKNSLSDATWTEWKQVVGTGGNVPLTDATAALQPRRFYRIMFTP